MMARSKKVIILGDHPVAESIIRHFNVLQREVVHHKRLDRELIDEAHKDATEQTLWERIIKTNHKDVTYYKGLLHEYTRDLLMVMRHDFLEEITGRYIESKAFEDD